MASCRSGTKRNIKKASKNGIEITISNSPDTLSTFHNLNCLTGKKHVLPSQTLSFFERIYKNILKNYYGFIILESNQSNTIAGAVFFNSAIYKFHALDVRYQNLRANNLSFWDAINTLKREGCTILNFEKTSIPHEGLRQFNNDWIFTENEIHYYNNNVRENKFEISEKLAEKWFPYQVF